MSPGTTSAFGGSHARLRAAATRKSTSTTCGTRRMRHLVRLTCRQDGALRRPSLRPRRGPEDWRGGRERPRSPLPSVARPSGRGVVHALRACVCERRGCRPDRPGRRSIAAVNVRRTRRDRERPSRAPVSRSTAAPYKALRCAPTSRVREARAGPPCARGLDGAAAERSLGGCVMAGIRTNTRLVQWGWPIFARRSQSSEPSRWTYYIICNILDERIR